MLTKDKAVSVGASTTLEGQLFALVYINAKPVAGEPMVLQQRAVGSSAWTDVKTVTSSSTGKVSVTVKPTISTQYRWKHNDRPGVVGPSTSGAVTISVNANNQLGYQGHVQNIGWQSWVSGGQIAGTTGRGLRVEALRFRLNSPAYSGGLTARAHVQNIGWMAPVATGGVVGTQGRSLRVEAFTMQLTGEMAKHYDVYYRTHAQNFGWLGWAKNGAQSGTAGYAYRLEAVDVRLVPKGSPAPSGPGLNAFYQR